MKKSLSFLLITFLTVFNNNLNACECAEQPPYFCVPFKEMHHIFLVVVTNTLDWHNLEVKIIDNVQNSTTEDTLKILGHDGVNCGQEMSIFNLSDTLVLAIFNFETRDAELGELYDWSLSGCGRSYLYYSNNFVEGPIDETHNSQNYQAFKDNIVSCIPIPVSSYEIEKESIQLRVYPNPVSEYLFINLNGILEAQLDILNSKGQIVRSDLNFKPGNQQLIIDDLQNNQLYFMRVKTETGMIVLKFFKI